MLETEKIMNWIDISKNKAPHDIDILVLIERERRGELMVKEMHVAHTNKSDLWIIGNQFGFDMGKVTHWMELPNLPKQ